jgi:transcriptional regulator with XRE-family HTH domain
MSPQFGIRPATPDDEFDEGPPWSILVIAGNVIQRDESTTTRLGRPFTVRNIDDILPSLAEKTSSATSGGHQLWQTYVSSTDTGITYISAVRPVSEQVQRMRDDIARRTRLTRQQIARGVGVDRRSLSAWASGTATPSTEKLRRLQLLAGMVRDIDAAEPGRATEVLLSRSGEDDLLDHLAADRISVVRDWQAFRGSTPSVNIQHRRSTKRPLHQNALDAYLRGELHHLGRAATLRPESDYQQELSRAERLMPDEPARRSRAGYRS